MDLLENFIAFIKKEKLFTSGESLILAVSGGVDSVVLVELCYRAGFDFSIAHCHFGLRGEESDRDANFVKGLAEKYGVLFHLKKFDTKGHADGRRISIQMAARELRYQWFSELLVEASVGKPIPETINHRSNTKKEDRARWLLTAHQQDDNIETVVMNFFRGTGISGLRGMLPKSGKIIRPLLFATRERIMEYARIQKLAFVEDSSNLEEKYTRNFFRLQIIPQVEKAYPGTLQSLAAQLERFREVDLIYTQAISGLKKKLLTKSGNAYQVPVESIRQSLAASTLLFEISREFGFLPKQLPDLLNLLEADTGKFVCSSSHRMLRNRNWLIVSPLREQGQDLIRIEEDEKEIEFEGGKLRWEIIENSKALKIPASGFTAFLDAREVHFPFILRRWRSGDYFYPFGQRKKKKLARFFIDQKMSKLEKEQTWVLEMDKKIIWVLGRRIDDRFCVVPATKNILRLDYTTSPR